MDADKLTREQMIQLLEFFFYHLPMDQRLKLMRELPQAYNSACGKEVVQVVRVSDGSIV